MKRPHLEVNLGELDQLLDQATSAPMAVSDSAKVKTALHALAERLLARGRSSEKTRNVVPPASPEAAPAPPTSTETTEEPAAAPRKPGHGRIPAEDYVAAERQKVAHPELQHAGLCPECPKGKVYVQKAPATLVRIVGQAPLAARVIELERLRCNACGQVFTAPPPEDAGTAKFDETATAMIGLLKYGTGVPWNRLEALEQALGTPLPASTQWEVVQEGAELLKPARDELERQAAQAEVIHNDDTSIRILKIERPEGDERTGTFTSGLVACAGDKQIALFYTGRQHAGENLGDVLRARAKELPPPIQMCDALSRNVPKGVELLVANCLAHGRRDFVALAGSFPAECKYVLEKLGSVYAVDAEAREQKLTPEARLALHQARSKPLMDELLRWCDRQLGQKLVEPNSALGQAIEYLRKHWKKLTLFLTQAGAPLDNNLCERALKRAVLHRKNALFYKSLNGAAVGDLFMSLIHTCALNHVNPSEYLVALLRNPQAVEAAPGRWMPWNFREAQNNP